MTDTPLDERCDSCGRLDPASCTCPTDPTEPIAVDITVDLCTDETADVLVNIADERVAQVQKWGIQRRPDGTGPAWEVAATEAKRITDSRMADGTATWTDILLEEVFEALAESDPEKLRAELIQVAAVAASWAEDIDRKVAEL